MKKITEIEKIGKGARYRLFLDGELFGIFEAEILAKHCLKSGEEYDDMFFDELLIENGDYACFNRGLSGLEKSTKSEKMLQDYLKEKGYPIACINRAIEKLKSYGYIDDEAFCENFISCYASSKSKRKLKYDLLNKGIDINIIEKKLEEKLTSEEEEEKCLIFAKKYMKNREFDLKTKQKLFNHLAGKGFDFGLISSAWDKIKNNSEEI